MAPCHKHHHHPFCSLHTALVIQWHQTDREQSAMLVWPPSTGHHISQPCLAQLASPLISGLFTPALRSSRMVPASECVAAVVVCSLSPDFAQVDLTIWLREGVACHVPGQATAKCNVFLGSVSTLSGLSACFPESNN